MTTASCTLTHTQELAGFANLDPCRAPLGRQSHFVLSLPSSGIFH